jgi:hypothetical protein
MIKNINIYVYFTKRQNSQCAYFCTDQRMLKQFLFVNEIITTPTTHLEQITIQVRKDKFSHSGLSKFLPSIPLVMIAHNVCNEKQLKIWIQIKGKTFVPDEDWCKYLHSKNLLEPWIDGELKVCIGSGYLESSKQFGYRTRYQEVESVESFDNNIWNFINLYNGIKKRTTGYYDNYWYQTESRIILIKYGEKTFEVNEQWKEVFKPQEKVFVLSELRKRKAL